MQFCHTKKSHTLCRPRCRFRTDSRSSSSWSWQFHGQRQLLKYLSGHNGWSRSSFCQLSVRTVFSFCSPVVLSCPSLKSWESEWAPCCAHRVHRRCRTPVYSHTSGESVFGDLLCPVKIGSYSRRNSSCSLVWLSITSTWAFFVSRSSSILLNSDYVVCSWYCTSLNKSSLTVTVFNLALSANTFVTRCCSCVFSWPNVLCLLNVWPYSTGNLVIPTLWLLFSGELVVGLWTQFCKLLEVWVDWELGCWHLTRKCLWWSWNMMTYHIHTTHILSHI